MSKYTRNDELRDAIGAYGSACANHQHDRNKPGGSDDRRALMWERIEEIVGRCDYWFQGLRCADPASHQGPHHMFTPEMESIGEGDGWTTATFILHTGASDG